MATDRVARFQSPIWQVSSCGEVFLVRPFFIGKSQISKTPSTPQASILYKGISSLHTRTTFSAFQPFNNPQAFLSSLIPQITAFVYVLS